MLPNRVSTTDSAAARADGGPQLKLAARTTQDVRDPAQTATSAVINDEVHRSHGEWRRTLDAVKETLASLERTCASAIEANEAGIPGLIDTLVASAKAEADVAAQQTRAQAENEIAELRAEMAGLQTVVDSLQADLEVERDRLKNTTEQLDIEVRQRVLAESERDESRRVCQQVVSAAESQAKGLRADSEAQKAELSQVRQQLEAVSAERSKLMATFQSLQRVLSLSESGEMAFAAENAGRDRVPPAERHPQEARPENGLDAAAALADPASSLTDAQVALIEANPEAVEDIRQVLEQVEAVYSADLKSGRSPMEVVDALTGNLRYARDVTIARSTLAEGDAEMLFDGQVAVLLDLKGGTSFGRHLSISAYALHKPVAPAQGESGNPQQAVE